MKLRQLLWGTRPSINACEGWRGESSGSNDAQRGSWCPTKVDESKGWTWLCECCGDYCFPWTPHSRHARYLESSWHRDTRWGREWPSRRAVRPKEVANTANETRSCRRAVSLRLSMMPFCSIHSAPAYPVVVNSDTSSRVDVTRKRLHWKVDQSSNRTLRKVEKKIVCSGSFSMLLVKGWCCLGTTRSCGVFA